MRIVGLVDGRLGRRTVRGCLRIVEVVLRNRGLGTHGRHLARHGRPRSGRVRRVLFGIARRAPLRRAVRIRRSGRRIGRRRSGRMRRLRGLRLRIPHARAAGIGVETGIPIEDQVVLVAACRVAVTEQNRAAALVRIARQIDKGIALLLVLLGRIVRPSVRSAQMQDVLLGRRILRRGLRAGHVLRGRHLRHALHGPGRGIRRHGPHGLRCRRLHLRRNAARIIRRRRRNGISVDGRALCGRRGRRLCGRHCRMLGLGQVVKLHGLFLGRHGLLRFAHPRRGQKMRAQRRCDEDEPDRKRGEKGKEDIRPHRGKHRAHGIHDQAEERSAARPVREIGLGGSPAGGEISAESAAEVLRRRRRMYDEKRRNHKQKEAQNPTRRNPLLPEGKCRRAVDGKDQQRIDKVPRDPHEKRRDRHADLPEHIPSRYGNEKNDRTEQEQCHSHCLPCQKRPFIFIFFFFSASDAVQIQPPYPPRIRGPSSILDVSIHNSISFPNEFFNDFMHLFKKFANCTIFIETNPSPRALSALPRATASPCRTSRICPLSSFFPHRRAPFFIPKGLNLTDAFFVPRLCRTAFRQCAERRLSRRHIGNVIYPPVRRTTLCRRYGSTLHAFPHAESIARPPNVCHSFGAEINPALQRMSHFAPDAARIFDHNQIFRDIFPFGGASRSIA